MYYTLYYNRYIKSIHFPFLFKEVQTKTINSLYRMTLMKLQYLKIGH